MKWRLLHTLLVGLVLAGIVHIVIIFLIPKYGTRDAWAFLSSRTDQFSFTRLDNNRSGNAIAETDPFFAYGICRFDLSENGVIIQGQKSSTYWSASVFNDSGTVLYSLNDRTAIDNLPYMVIVSPVQSLELREIQPAELETSVVIEANTRRGYVIIRVLEPDSSYRDASQKFLGGISCKPYEPQPDLPPQDAASETDSTGEDGKSK